MIHPYIFVGMKDFTVTNDDKKIADSVINTVMNHFNISKDLIIEKSRKREIVIPRQIAMWIIKKKTAMSLMKIGELFGGFDHTTIMHSIHAINNALDTKDETICPHVLLLKQKVDSSIYRKL